MFSYPLTPQIHDIVSTSIRRRRRRLDVLQTLKRRSVSTGSTLCLLYVALFSCETQPFLPTKYNITDRSSGPEVFCEKVVLINFTKFTGKLLQQSLQLRLQVCNFTKRDTCACFPVNFVKSLRTLFLQNTSDRLLLQKL